jgi:DnaJ-domain-containing protein 1
LTIIWNYNYPAQREFGKMSLMHRIGRILKNNMSDLKERLSHGNTVRAGSTTFQDRGHDYSEQPSDPADLQEAEYLANLELSGADSFQEIKDAYKRMIRKYHPDLHAQDAEKREFAKLITQRLNEALDYFERKYEKEGKSGAL